MKSCTFWHRVDMLTLVYINTYIGTFVSPNIANFCTIPCKGCSCNVVISPMECLQCVNFYPRVYLHFKESAKAANIAWFRFRCVYAYKMTHQRCIQAKRRKIPSRLLWFKYYNFKGHIRIQILIINVCLWRNGSQ